VSVVCCQVEVYDELIARLEESYRLWCVVVCDLETSWMKKPRPALGRGAPPKIITLSAIWILLSRSGDITFVCALPALLYLGFSPLILSNSIVLPIPILPDNSFTFSQSVSLRVIIHMDKISSLTLLYIISYVCCKYYLYLKIIMPDSLYVPCVEIRSDKSCKIGLYHISQWHLF
jgi:hypothetical protein